MNLADDVVALVNFMRPRSRSTGTPVALTRSHEEDA